MSRSIRLRAWQQQALARFRASIETDFLAVATPGAGKTTFALTAARLELAVRPRRLFVVAPTAHLKLQWARAAHQLGLHLDPAWSAADGVLPSDMHGIVTTYQQVASAAPVLAGLAQDAVVILDELHHAGDDRAWGDAVRTAFEGASRRLALSGTPFRSDTRSIPFVRYVGDEAVPDVEYGYGNALGDGGVVRPIYFPRTDGHMEWMAPDGSLNSATFADALDLQRANQRLRTALSLEGEWLRTVVRNADARLVELRDHQPDAGGLVIASDQEHARGIARLLRDEHGRNPVIVLSDDPEASQRIAAFAAGTQPWIVAVRMVSEGVDIPRLRVGVYATTTTTELFFRQAVGRLVRWQRGLGRQKAYLFIPDDPRLRAHAFQIADARRHSLRRKERDGDEPDPDAIDDPLREEERKLDGGEQLSLFAALSAVALGDPQHIAPPAFDGDPDPREPDDDASLDLDLPPPPPTPSGVNGIDEGGNGGGLGTLTRKELKARLRDANAELASLLALRTGWEHARVNAELNRLAGLRSVREATIEQLERRKRAAERWLSKA
jgi:superfamily II DNA or RNA helicase